jgi:hypothetical protein
VIKEEMLAETFHFKDVSSIVDGTEVTVVN